MSKHFLIFFLRVNLAIYKTSRDIPISPVRYFDQLAMHKIKLGTLAAGTVKVTLK